MVKRKSYVAKGNVGRRQKEARRAVQLMKRILIRFCTLFGPLRGARARSWRGCAM